MEKELKSKYTQLYLSDNKKIDNLFKIYKKNPYNARVIYFNDNIGYDKYRLGLFEKENGDFNIVLFRKKYGISITNKIYNNEKKVVNICYKNKKFWLINNHRGKKITQLTLDGISGTLTMVQPLIIDVIYKYLITRFSWLKHITDHKILRNVSFNTIVSKKIYSLKKGLQHQYKVPYPVAKILHKISMGYSRPSELARNFKYYLRYLKNVENLKKEWFSDDNVICFHDTIKMAKTLDKRINCSWSIKRLTQEHDKWSEEMTDILFTHNNRNLNIAKIFKDFAKESGYNIIKDVKNLNLEGKKMGHCVASYVSKIESCKCAIFHVNDYTLELIKEYYPDSDSRLIIGQFSGKHNIKIPSKELTKEVKTALDKFNEKNKLRKYSTHVTEESWDW